MAEMNIADKPLGEEVIAMRMAKEMDERLQHAMATFEVSFTELAEAFLAIQPLYFDNAEIWWAWSFKLNSWEMIDDYDVLNLIKKHNQNQKTKDLPILRKDHILNALRLSGRAHRPEELPKTCVQFRDVILDVTDGGTFEASPKLFCMNPIPWKLGPTSETPTIDALFAAWVEPRYVPTLFEILAYCTLPNYPIHRAFFLCGTGANGKGQFQALIERFVGSGNCCSASLTGLEQDKHATFSLYRKLVCQMGETNFDRLMGSEQFKKLTGNDLVDFQQKYKNTINDKNYAKLVINSNGLPTPYDDSEGFWRRVLPIEFPNKFQEGPSPVEALSNGEMECLARKISEILPELLRRARFTGEGTLEERKKRYMSLSNPLAEFIDERYIRAESGRVKYTFMYDEYKRWLSANRRRPVPRHEFKEALVQESLDIDRQRFGPDQDVTTVVVGIIEKSKAPAPISAVARSATCDDGKNQTLPAADPRPILDTATLLQHLRNAVLPQPFATILESVNEAAGNYAGGSFWLTVSLKQLEREAKVIQVGADSWTVLE